MNKTAADLGQRNMPKGLIQQVVPGALRALYWREESSMPENHILEIWGSESATFYLIDGDFVSGEWSEQNIQFIGEYDEVHQAVQAARSNYVIMEDSQPKTEASSTFKRLIKKSK